MPTENWKGTPTWYSWRAWGGKKKSSFEDFLKKWGPRPSERYRFSPGKGWVLKKKKRPGRPEKHGFTGTPTYWTWQGLRRTGRIEKRVSFSAFLKKWGPKPGRNWHFVPGKGWAPNAIQKLKPLWKWLSPEEIVKLEELVQKKCQVGGYDADVALNKFWCFEVSKLKNPEKMTRHRICTYLMREMSREPKFVPLTALGREGRIYFDESDFETD